MAFTMRGLSQYGDEGPKQLGHRLKSIFGKKEERAKYKQYFKDKKAAKKGLKETGLFGEVTDMSQLEGKNLGKSTAKTRRNAAKRFAQDNLDGKNEIDAVYTTEKVKKKDVQGGANAAAYANVNRGTGVDLDIDFDIKNTKYQKDTSGPIQNYRTENTVTVPGTNIPGEKKSEVFEGPDALERANKFEQDMINAGNLKVKSNDGVDMKGMGYHMKSNMFQLSGAEDKAKIMQVNRNPINVTETPLTTSQGYGSGTQTDTSQDSDTYSWSGKKSTAFKPSEKNDPTKNACADPDSAACAAWKKTREVPGSSSMDQKVTVNYQTPSTSTPSTTTTTVDEGSKVGNFGGQTGNKLSIDADVDADAKIKLPKIKLPEIITDANNDGTAIGRGIKKFKKKRKERKIARNVAKGNCPPCPPCEK